MQVSVETAHPAEGIAISSLVPSQPLATVTGRAALTAAPAALLLHAQNATADPIATPRAADVQQLAVACCRQASVTVWRQCGAICSWDVEKGSAAAPSPSSPALAAGHVVAAWADGGDLLLVLAPGATRVACWRMPGAARTPHAATDLHAASAVHNASNGASVSVCTRFVFEHMQRRHPQGLHASSLCIEQSRTNSVTDDDETRRSQGRSRFSAGLAVAGMADAGSSVHGAPVAGGSPQLLWHAASGSASETLTGLAVVGGQLLAWSTRTLHLMDVHLHPQDKNAAKRRHVRLCAEQLRIASVMCNATA